MGNEEHLFLGKGWRFPPRFSASNLETDMVSEEEDILQSLFIILSTRKGERRINPEFGCGIHDLVFEEIDNSIQYRIRDLVETAILYFEPRIVVNKIEVNLEKHIEGRLNIHIDFNIRTVNKRSNMVYPFYYLEGTDLRLKP